MAGMEHTTRVYLLDMKYQYRIHFGEVLNIEVIEVPQFLGRRGLSDDKAHIFQLLHCCQQAGFGCLRTISAWSSWNYGHKRSRASERNYCSGHTHIDIQYISRSSWPVQRKTGTTVEELETVPLDSWLNQKPRVGRVSRKGVALVTSLLSPWSSTRLVFRVYPQL